MHTRASEEVYITVQIHIQQLAYGRPVGGCNVFSSDTCSFAGHKSWRLSLSGSLPAGALVQSCIDLGWRFTTGQESSLACMPGLDTRETEVDSEGGSSQRVAAARMRFTGKRTSGFPRRLGCACVRSHTGGEGKTRGHMGLNDHRGTVLHRIGGCLGRRTARLAIVAESDS